LVFARRHARCTLHLKLSSFFKRILTIVTNVSKLAELLPAEEKYGLRSQICRAVVSVPSNIAEGCSRNSQMDFKRFLEIAFGSSDELETQLMIIEELSLISNKEVAVIIDPINKEQKMLNNVTNHRVKANNFHFLCPGQRWIKSAGISSSRRRLIKRSALLKRVNTLLNVVSDIVAEKDCER